MSNHTADLLESALSLPDTDRSYLASKLLESLEVDEVSAEWKNEIGNRVSEIRDGHASLIDHRSAVACVRRALDA